MTHPLFKSMGELKSINFRGKGVLGDDAYDLTFANGKVLMSAYLDAQGRMAGGILAPQGAVRRPLRKCTSLMVCFLHLEGISSAPYRRLIARPIVKFYPIM